MQGNKFPESYKLVITIFSLVTIFTWIGISGYFYEDNFYIYYVTSAYTFYNPLENRALIDKVEQHNKFHDFEPITLNKTSLLNEYGIGKLLLHFDGHPSPLLNKISANALGQELKKKHFSLEK